jgi:hypothetical protein
MLVITYAAEHNHPIPTTTKQHRHSVSAAVKLSPKIEEEEEDDDEGPGDGEVYGDVEGSGDGDEEEEGKEQEVSLLPQTKQEVDLLDVLTWQGNIELYDGYEFGWYADVAAVTSGVLEDTTTMSSSCCSTTTDADVEKTFKMREEDELLFADLGELPECSMVFQRNGVVPESAVSYCAGTGG